MRYKVLSADHHRNGVGGEGFYVGLIRTSEHPHPLLVTWFPEYADHDREVLAKFQTRIAVIDPLEASTGNVYMHPEGEHAGNNAFRGDHFQDLVRAIRDAVEARRQACGVTS